MNQLPTPTTIAAICHVRRARVGVVSNPRNRGPAATQHRPADSPHPQSAHAHYGNLLATAGGAGSSLTLYFPGPANSFTGETCLSCKVMVVQWSWICCSRPACRARCSARTPAAKFSERAFPSMDKAQTWPRPKRLPTLIEASSEQAARQTRLGIHCKAPFQSAYMH